MTVALLLMLLQATTPSAAVAPPLSVSLAPNDYLVGPMNLDGALNPEGLPITRADFFVDGILRCRIEAPPLTCRHDFGPELRRHRIQLIVTLPDGQRVSTHYESKALVLDEAVSVQNVFL